MGARANYSTEEINFITSNLQAGMDITTLMEQCLNHSTLFNNREENGIKQKICRLRNKIRVENHESINDIETYKNLDIFLTKLNEVKKYSPEDEALYTYISDSVYQLKFHASEEFKTFFNTYRDNKYYEEQAVIDKINNNSSKVYTKTYFTKTDIAGMKSRNRYMRLRDFIVVCSTIQMDIYDGIDNNEFNKLLSSIRVKGEQIKKFIKDYNLSFDYVEMLPIYPSVINYKNSPNRNKNVATIDEIKTDVIKCFHFDSTVDLTSWEEILLKEIPLTIQTEEPVKNTVLIKNLKDLPDLNNGNEEQFNEEQFKEYITNAGQDNCLTTIGNIFDNYKNQYNLDITWNANIRKIMSDIILSIYPDLIAKYEPKQTKTGQKYTEVHYELCEPKTTDNLFNLAIDDCILEKLMDMKFNTIGDAIKFKARLLNIMADYI